VVTDCQPRCVVERGGGLSVSDYEFWGSAVRISSGAPIRLQNQYVTTSDRQRYGAAVSLPAVCPAGMAAEDVADLGSGGAGGDEERRERLFAWLKSKIAYAELR